MTTLLLIVGCLVLFNAMWLFTLMWVLSQRAHTPLRETFSRKTPATTPVDELDLSQLGDFGDANEILNAMLPHRPVTRHSNPVTPAEEDESPIE